MTSIGTYVRRAVGITLLAAVALVAPASAVANDPTQFGLSSFTTSVVDENGVEVTQAGAHPFAATAHFTFNTRTAVGDEVSGDAVYPVEELKDTATDLPPGFVGDPTATSVRCKSEELERADCPIGAQVGLANVVIMGGTANVGIWNAVYNMVPTPGHPAMLGMKVSNVGVVQLFPRVRSEGDYGLTVTTLNNIAVQVVDVTLTLWGVPADPGHDIDRYKCYFDGFFCSGPNPPADPPKPFLTLPASECTGEQPITRMRIDSWQHPGVFKEFTALSPAITGCDALTFEPSADAVPTTSKPDAPTGLDVGLEFPTEDNAAGLAPPALKKAVVTLPEGMSINPTAADGLAACDDAGLKLKSTEPVDCPDASKIGTVTVKSPVLEEELTGGVFVRSQNSDDPESGEMFRIALVVENEERGLSFRLPGQVRANKDTGRLETVFDNNPELPVSDIDVKLKDGPRAPLATPPTCGDKTIDVQLTSWGGQTVNRTSEFNVDCVAGLGGFAPSLAAGATSAVGGEFSPFVVNIAKRDGDTALNGVSLTMPTGLLAKVKGNLGQQVGTVRAFAGPGSQPFMLPGKVFLEGRYGDAPYSLRVVVPAKAGPFDLGDVVVRQKIYVDPVSAQVTVASDPLPTIVKGVPVRLQRLDVSVDKPGFTLNPTSCAAKEIAGTLSSAAGQAVPVVNRFQVGDCALLPFNPKLAMSLTGRRQVTTGKHPGVKAQVNQTGVGEAGIQKAKVTLPKSLALDPDNAQALCEFEAGTKPDLEKHCPAGSIVGRARAKTPLLDRDLVGNVYFVKNVRKDPETGNAIRTLPMIVVALRGEIAVNLKGESSTTKSGRLVNTFANVPDAPITKFNLNIAGGNNGILAVTRTRKAKINVCASRQTADADMDGQNGRIRDFRVRIKTPCAKSAKKTKKAGRAKK